MSEKEILKYTDENAEDAALDIKTTDILMRVGVPVSSKGYEYLRCAVILVYHTPEIATYITKTLYPKVARLCHASGAAVVERNCRHALRHVFSVENSVILRELFGLDITLGHPTCAQFISAVAQYLHSVSEK